MRCKQTLCTVWVLCDCFGEECTACVCTWQGRHVQWSALWVLVKLNKLAGGYLGLQNALGPRCHACSIKALWLAGRGRIAFQGHAQAPWLRVALEPQAC
jgi:hypothetical protein